jgi:phage-related protein
MHTLSKTLVSVSILLLLGHAGAEETTDSTTIKSSPGPVDKVTHAIKRGASAAASGIERGVNAAAHGIERGAKATARGIEKGANATGNAAHRVADKIGGSSDSPASPASVPVSDR